MGQDHPPFGLDARDSLTAGARYHHLTWFYHGEAAAIPHGEHVGYASSFPASAFMQHSDRRTA